MHLFNSQKTDVETLFLRYGDMLYRVSLARLGNDADAQDAVQEVFAKYISAKPVFENCDHAKAWFLRTTVNHCHDMARREKVRAHSSLDEAHNVAFDQQTGLRDLLDLIFQLPSKYADVIILHSLEGFTVEETAGLLQISPSAVKMRLSRGREALQKLREE